MDRAGKVIFGSLRKIFPARDASEQRKRNRTYWGASDNDIEPPVSEKHPNGRSCGTKTTQGLHPILTKMLCFYFLGTSNYQH